MIPLAGPANRQGRLVADKLAGLKKSYRGSQGTAVRKLVQKQIQIQIDQIIKFKFKFKHSIFRFKHS